MIKVSLINLGCAKNRVDSEAILALFNDTNKFLVTTDLEESDVIIINTCAFILDAENESFDTIEEVLNLNKKTVVVGCLVEKYHEFLRKKFAKVDLFVGFKDFINLPKLISELIKIDIDKPYTVFDRMMDENTYSIYLKISEGCNHRCGYCIIPKLRGNYYSYDEDKIVDFAKKKVNEGVKELTLIAQDTTYYGKDLENKSLETLLKRLDAIEGIEFIRVLYFYPNEVTPSIIKTYKEAKHIVPYFDLPIQHASDKILKSMNRNDTYESLTNLISLIRKEIPSAILRATLIVGYPGETLNDIELLKKFLIENRIHHVGCFTYSNEELSPAYKFENQIDEEEKIKRKDEIMRLQRSITYSLNKELVGKIFKAIVIEEGNNNFYKVRCAYNAPDDIDGDVLLKTSKTYNIGDILNVKIADAYTYDLIAIEAE